MFDPLAAVRPRSGILQHRGDTLPARTRGKLAALNEQLEMLNDASYAAGRRRMTAGDDLRRAEGVVRQLVEHTGRQDPKMLAAARADVAAAEALETRRAILAEEAAAAADPLRLLAERIAAYIEGNASQITEVAPIIPKASRDALPIQLHAQRLAIARMQEQAATMRAAPPTDAEIIAVITEEVQTLAARGQPMIYGGKISWPEVIAFGADGGPEPATRTLVPDAAGIAAWVDPEGMRKRLAAQALAERRERGIMPGLPVAERAIELRKLGTDLLIAERIEEWLIEQLAVGGTSLQRRPDADPRAVLGIDGPPPAVD